MSLKKFIRYLNLNLLPSTCILCTSQLHQAKQIICYPCQKDLPILPKCCAICAQFLSHEATCGNCLKNSPPFDVTFALFPYQPPIIQLIYALKFHHQLYCANLFANLFITDIQNSWYQTEPLPDVIMPVPLHYQRLRERGFNQAVEIAKLIAKKLAICLDIDGIIRIKNTRTQSGLKAHFRKQNLNQAFAAREPNDYANQTVAILDDVVTTGCTISALAEVLKQNGAKTIHIWCCARRG